MMTSLVFRVRNIPAALYKAMGGFATNGVNMTKLESYMVGGRFSATQFYAEVEGHPEDAPLARALEELRYFSDHVGLMGVFPAARARATRLSAARGPVSAPGRPAAARRAAARLDLAGPGGEPLLDPPLDRAPREAHPLQQEPRGQACGPRRPR